MKTILFITRESLNDPKRGTPIRILNFARQIKKKYRIVLCARDGPLDLVSGMYEYPIGNWWKRFSFFVWLIKHTQPDLVMVSTETEINYPVFLKLVTGAKIVIDLHGLYAEEMYQQGTISRFKKNVLELRTKILIRFFDLVLVCSGKNYDYYQRFNRRVATIYNGVDPQLLPLVSKIKSTVYTIGYAGNFKPYQGLEFLLDACRNLHQRNAFPFKLKLILSSGATKIGPELERRGLHELTELHLKVTQPEAHKLISGCSVLIVPRPLNRVTEYGYPSKLPEDLLSGIPTITTDVCPVSELFRQANCCVIVPHDNIVENLELALTCVYQMSAEEREQMTTRARRFVLQRLTWDVVGRELNRQLAEAVL